MRTFLEEFARETPRGAVRSKIGANDVLEVPYPVVQEREGPGFICSEVCAKFIAVPLHSLAHKSRHQSDSDLPKQALGIGYNNRFNGPKREELLKADWHHPARKAPTAIIG